MGKGGSSSSSSSTTNAIDRRQVVDTGSVGVSSDSSTVNVTNQVLDAGAVEGALEFADSVNANALDALKGIIGLAGKTQDNIDKAGTLVATAYENAKGAGFEKTAITIGVIGAVALVAVRAFK